MLATTNISASFVRSVSNQEQNKVSQVRRSLLRIEFSIPIHCASAEVISQLTEPVEATLFEGYPNEVRSDLSAKDIPDCDSLTNIRLLFTNRARCCRPGCSRGILHA